ncbi:MAG: NADH-quinone oxidoreductase subunit H [Acidobacteria bacterium]|nr:NADH-quinone oxidoreductase subunit H [Acidobacteriota bacterium]
MPPITLAALKPYIMMVLIVGIGPLGVGYLVLLERKLMADMQARLGPMRVGPQGLLQPIADAVKLLLKEDVIPGMVDKWVFWLAPCVTVTTALAAFAVVPFSSDFVITDVNIGVLAILALSSVGVLGIILGGWAANSHYPLLGSLRATAQMVSYEVVMGFAVVAVLLMAGSLSMVEIVKAQAESHRWFLFGAFPFGLIAFFMYYVAAMAETNRSPFDLPEAESELVAGFMTEYSGFRWALYFLAEYCNIIVVCSLAVTLFLGGWLRPFPSVTWLGWLDYAAPVGSFLLAGGLSLYLVKRQPRAFDQIVLAAVGLALLAVAGLFAWPAFNALFRGVFWFMAKIMVLVYSFMWVRFTFPRYRYDQLMRLGWRVMIPLGIVNVIAIGIVLVLKG